MTKREKKEQQRLEALRIFNLAFERQMAREVQKLKEEGFWERDAPVKQSQVPQEETPEC